MDPVTVRAGLTDRLQRGQNVARRFLLTDNTPHRVVTNRVAAMELSHPVQLVIVRRHPLRMRCRRPRPAADRADRQRAELVERETPIRPGVRDVFDPVKCLSRSREIVLGHERSEQRTFRTYTYLAWSALSPAMGVVALVALQLMGRKRRAGGGA